MVIESPITGEKEIVPEFDSARQISREDDLQMRIGLIGDREERAQFEDAYRKCERREEMVQRVLVYAENAYINRHLTPEQNFQPSPFGDLSTYEQQVRQRREEFHARPETQAFKDRADLKCEREWQKLESHVRLRVDHQQEPHLSKEAFSNIRSNRAQVSRCFQRAVGR